MPIQFNVSPFSLSLLTAALAGSYFYFWWCYRRTLTDMGAGRKRLSLAIRLVIVTLLFLAISQVRWVRRHDALSVIFLMDASKSVRPEQREAEIAFVNEAVKHKRANDTAGVITFGLDPDIKSMPAADVTVKEIKHNGPTNASNIAEALDAALSMVPRNSAGKVVVLSDGNENVGNALGEVTTLTARNVRADTVLLPSPLKKEALIDKTVLPSRVKIGEPFTVKVITSALNSQHGRLVLRRDGQPLGTARDIDIAPGKRVHDFEVRIDKPGFYKFEAALETDPNADTILENNKGLGFVTVRGRPQVLYVSPTPSLMKYIQKSLASQNIDVLYAPPQAMPTTAAAFQHFDSVILSDVPRDAFSVAQMQALQISTRDFGVGFGMIGGENSFGVGGYRNTAIEETLPVSLEVKKQKRMPSVAVALVIEDLEIPASVNMSKEASKALIDLLDPMDEAGVLDCNGFGSANGWRIPLQHVTDRAAMQSQIDSLNNMGDPPSYDPFLLEAARALQASSAKIKHIIFLGDGDAIWEGQQSGMGSTMQKIRNMGITVSTVATAADQNGIAFMAAIARDGGGHSYVADQPADLPRILLKDQQTISAPPIIEEPFIPRKVPGDDVVKGVAGMPELLGYNIATPKPTAGTSLISHRNDPILCTWRYGLGRSMAFMSDDKNKWAVHWLPWGGYGQFWAEAVRWTMRSFTPSDFQTQVTMEGTRGHVSVDAIDKDGKFVNRLDFRAKVVGPEADGSKPAPDLQLRQTGPGHYEAWFDAAKIGTYLVHVTRERPDKQIESTVTGLVVPYSPEYKDLTANDYLMTQMAQVGGGAATTDPAQVFGANRPSVFAPVELYQKLLFLAMLLFPFDVAVRRLALQRDDFERAWAWLRSRFAGRSRAPGRGATPELARLRNVKERALAGVDGGPLTMDEGVAGATDAEAVMAAASVGTQPTSARPSEQPGSELGGMSRLMEAKRRAKEQQKPKDES